MNLTLSRLLCVAISIGASILSTTLTVQFMYNLGASVNSPILMGSLGLVLDATKCASPIFIGVFLTNKKLVSACFTTLIAVTLSVVSFAASVAALEEGVSSSKQKGTMFVSIQAQIDSYNQQIEDLRTQAESQRSINHITKAEQTVSSISPLLAKVEKLRSEQANLASESSTVAKYGMVVIYIASAALELIVWVLISLSNTLFPSKHSQSQSSTVELSETHNETQPIENTNNHSSSFAHTLSVINQFNTVMAANENQFETTLPFNEHAVESESKGNLVVNTSKREEVLYFEIRDAILAQKVKPSHRGIQAAFSGVSRDLINTVLSDLNESGILKPYRKGYAFA